MAESTSKRKRISEAGTRAAMASLDKHAEFTTWAQDQGVDINGVKAAHIRGRGIGIETTKRIKAGTRLLFIPEKAMFKPDAKLLRRQQLRATSPQAQLAITALLKFREHSKLWQSVLPTYNDFEQSMPTLWPTSIRKHFPPGIQQPLERLEADYERDLAAVQQLLNKIQVDEQDFQYWWLIVNSRSFHWKSPKSRAGTMVLCPFIDYMNHAPTGNTCLVNMTDDGYEVIANRDYGKFLLLYHISLKSHVHFPQLSHSIYCQTCAFGDRL